jgi:hypothetical protein
MRDENPQQEARFGLYEEGAEAARLTPADRYPQTGTLSGRLE